MDTDRSAPISGFSHVQLLVRDVATSERWYAQVLGLERFVASDDGSYVALRHLSSKFLIVLSTGLRGVDANERSEPLDHLAFAVPDGAALEAWAAQLTALGIDHPGVVDELGKPSLVLTDPDGIHIELVAPPGTWSGSTPERTETVG
jgi:catechol-2,3-dioxygenase